MLTLSSSRSHIDDLLYIVILVSVCAVCAWVRVFLEEHHVTGQFNTVRGGAPCHMTV